MNKSPVQQADESLAGFVLELSRRRPRFTACLDGEVRQPLSAILYRIYQAPDTLEHRTVIHILKEIVRNSDKPSLHRDQLVALSADMLHLLYYLISDFKECRYAPEEIKAGITWIEGQSGDVGMWGHRRGPGG